MGIYVFRCEVINKRKQIIKIMLLLFRPDVPEIRTKCS